MEKCLNDTRVKLFDYFDDDTKLLSANHEQVLFCNGLRLATFDDFDLTMKKFANTTDPRLRQLFIRSMSCIENEEILTRFIQAFIQHDDENNKTLDDGWEIALEALCSSSQIGTRVALKFLRNHHELIMEM